MRPNNFKRVGIKHAIVNTKTSQNVLGESALKIISVFISLGSVFTFFLWLAGRIYAAGYFNALGITSYMVSFQTWDYIEQAWSPLALLLILIVAMVWIVDRVSTLIAGGIKAISLKLFQRKTTRKVFIFEKVNKSTIRQVLYFLLTVLSLYILRLGLLGIYIFGLAEGNHYISTSPQVELVSNNPIISLALPTIVNDEKNIYYMYNNLHLLTFNNSKYYMFDEFDTNTCRPKNVYIIDNSYITYLALSSQNNPVIPVECQAKFSFALFNIPFPTYIPQSLIMDHP